VLRSRPAPGLEVVKQIGLVLIVLGLAPVAPSRRYTASQRYTQYYENIWAAIHNHPLLDAILW
jgi:hypothetical protein